MRYTLTLLILLGTMTASCQKHIGLANMEGRRLPFNPTTPKSVYYQEYYQSEPVSSEFDYYQSAPIRN